MNFLSVNFILPLIFFGYVLNTIWTLSQMFIPPSCKNREKCFTSYLIKHPDQDFYLFTSKRKNPSPNDIIKVDEIKKFLYNEPFTRTVALQIPQETRNNGTLYLHIAIADFRKRSWTWDELRARSSIERIPLVVFTQPQAVAFNLLEKSPEALSDLNLERPVAHLKSRVAFSILADPISIPANGVPGELLQYIRLSNDDEYFPIIQYDFLKSRSQDLVEIKKNSSVISISLEYSPASIGKMKLLVHISLALKSLYSMGFSEKNVDEVKGIFADTNIYLLCATVLISSFHLLFDFLAFKNDVSFWKGKKSMVGLSPRTVLWRAFSQIIVLLYLIDENTSLLILIPSGIGTLIELWKVKKILHIDIDWKEKKLSRILKSADVTNKAEQRTRAVDAEAMRYLSYLLYPLCICGAIYSLLYEPHKSWYSWTLHSMVNGVYAFGFLFMLPQLFINYKLKSVAALPWRAFMYKAFNTFIDDIFAFIITMPVAHRVACFRDDIVFLIYLYQRWLYPVDKTRVDNAVSIEETVQEVHESEKQKQE